MDDELRGIDQHEMLDERDRLLEQLVVAGMDELRGIDQREMLDERDRLLEQLVVAKAAARHLPGAPQP